MQVDSVVPSGGASGGGTRMNNNCLWLSLAVLVWLGAARAEAQPERGRPSHRPLEKDPADLTSPDDLLRERLLKARDFKRLDKIEKLEDLPPELKELAKKLLADPKMREKL